MPLLTELFHWAGAILQIWRADGAGPDIKALIFAVRQMVAVPAGQSRVAGVGKEEFQRRGFNVAVAKDDVGAALMAFIAPERGKTSGRYSSSYP